MYKDAPEVHAILETINANRTTLVGDALNNLVIRAQNAIGQLEPVEYKRVRHAPPFRLKSVTRR